MNFQRFYLMIFHSLFKGFSLFFMIFLWIFINFKNEISLVFLWIFIDIFINFHRSINDFSLIFIELMYFYFLNKMFLLIYLIEFLLIFWRPSITLPMNYPQFFDQFPEIFWWIFINFLKRIFANLSLNFH